MAGFVRDNLGPLAFVTGAVAIVAASRFLGRRGMRPAVAKHRAFSEYARVFGKVQHGRPASVGSVSVAHVENAFGAVGRNSNVVAFRSSSKRAAFTDGEAGGTRPQRTLEDLPRFSPDGGEPRRQNRRVSVAGESISPEELSSATKVVHPKPAETKERLIQIASKLLLFRSLDARQVADIVDAMIEKKVPAGTSIIHQGEEGDFFYLVDSGSFDVFVDQKKVTQVGPGGGFGELALMYGQPRAATVTAATDAVVWGVDRLSFRRIVVYSTLQKRRLHEAFLKEVPLLKSLNAPELVKAADALQPVSFKAGDVILTEGEIGDTFFIVEEGEVVVTKLDKKGVSQEMARKRRGEYFGAAATDVDCLMLDKQAFDRLLGPCVDILKRNMNNYQQYQQILDA